jgi:hypothetical protein
MELTNTQAPMSSNYKEIRKARENIKQLKAQGWSHAKIAKEMDVAHGKVQDILDIDEVALDFREPTMVKLRAFNEKMFGGETEEKPKEDPPTEGIPDPPPMAAKDCEFDHPGNTGAVTYTSICVGTGVADVLDALNTIGEMLMEKGYRLHARVEKIIPSEESDI